MNLLRVFVRRPVLTTMLVVTMLYLGFTGYRSLNLELMPRIDYPVIVVTTVYPGAAPGEIETQITKRIEDRVGTLANIEELESTSRESVSQVVIQFALETSQDQDAIDVKDRVDQIRSELPEDAEDPVIAKYDLGGAPVINFAVAADRPLEEVYRTVDQVIKERLSRVDGVAEVVVTGAREREVRVDVDPERLRFYNLSLQDVQDAIALQNVTIPGGKLSLGTYDYQVSVPGEVGRAEEILGFVLNPGLPDPVYIRDVAQVSFGIKDRESFSRVNGKEAVILTVTKRSGENIIDIVDEIKTVLERERPRLPAGT
ncbi:MAG: efflux RND transporter permease subunit, partial [bacterium]|nr:efflux RND transporter permease subunit [bacterium]